jgi:hypothetical protein
MMRQTLQAKTRLPIRLVMQLHSASRATYAYLDRIEASSQTASDVLFDMIVAGSMPWETGTTPAAAGSTTESAVSQNGAADDIWTQTFMAVCLLLGFGIGAAMVIELATPGATVSLLAIVGCGIAATWPATELERK